MSKKSNVRILVKNILLLKTANHLTMQGGHQPSICEKTQYLTVFLLSPFPLPIQQLHLP